MPRRIQAQVQQTLQSGLVIPACPLALNAQRQLDERRQRGLFRYYIGAGAGGLAVGVHTTQFAIRNPKVGLFRPVLELAAEEMARAVPPSAGKRFDGRVAFGSDPAGPAEAGTPTSPRVRIA